ncbi:tyrosine-type recombinase/integrase [Paenibacillus sp. 23TSA30-6]|uniref:tyrosine-type recombinase/integrase n=1 Tax=Paenibacillus sp. 23TSA30-6 TaxID=2546104 RepID=UPI001787AA1D|nr:tyrosine-type recombinase/integrase [Paenibacillus sp. 23TSA30-6]MBE0335079.1 site-specific integrase [Paenibacillus sp. 23TSA30-6]
MKGHFYKPHCKCVDAKEKSKKTKKCNCGASWSYILDVGIDPETGRRKQKKKGGFQTKTEAQDAAALLYAELTQGTYVEEKDITFEEFVKTWEGIYQGNGRTKISTHRVRKHEVGRLMPYFKKLKLKNITRDQYQEALNDLKTNGKKEGIGYADNTMDGIHRTGRMIFKKAVELGIIRNDPTEYAYVPKTQKTIDELENQGEEIKYLEKEELALFLKTAQEKGLNGDYESFLTLAYTGMRIGEFVALRDSDIDFKEHRISITKTYYNPTNNMTKYKLLPPKTKSSARTIDVDPMVTKALENYLFKLESVKIQYGEAYYDKGYIMPNVKKHPGYPRTIKQFQIRMSRLLDLAGLNTDLTPHSFRHTHVSLLAEAGVELHEIMDRLGHKDDDTTEQIYLHVTKEKKKEASHKFAELMRGLQNQTDVTQMLPLETSKDENP